MKTMAKDFYDVAEKTVTRELKRRVRREKKAACRFMREKSREYRTYTKALAKASFMGDLTNEALREKAKRKKDALKTAVAMAPILCILAGLGSYVLSGTTGTDLEITERFWSAFAVLLPLWALLETIACTKVADALDVVYEPIEERILEIRRKGEVPPVEALRRPATEHDLRKLDEEIARERQDIVKLRREQQLW